MAGKIDVALNDVIEKSKYKPPKPGGPKSKSKPPRKGFVGTSPAGTGMTNKFKGTKSGGGTIVKRPTLGGGGSSQPRPRPGVSARGGASSRFNQSGAFASRTLRPALGGGGRGGSRGGSAPREETLVVTRVINNQGGEDTRHKAGGVAKPRKAKAKAQRAAPYSKGNPDEQWGHDLYSANSSQDAERAESSPERTRSNSRRAIQTADNGGFLKRTLGEKAAKPKPKPAAGGTKVLISNLDYGVTTSDIKELFGSVGPLLRATVDTDGTGRSKGTASVVFVNEADAKSAIDEYNGAILDDKAIKMEFAPKIIRTVTSTASSSQGSFVVVQERGTSRKIVRRTTRGLASETF